MNNQQKAAFLCGVIIIAVMGLYPPWKEAGPKGLPLEYGPIFAPPAAPHPENGMEVDFVRLLLQVGVAAILSSGLIAAFAPPPAAPVEPRNTGGQSASGSASSGTSSSATSSSGGASSAIKSSGDSKKLAQKAGSIASTEASAVGEAKEVVDEDETDEAEGGHVLRLPGSKSYGEFLVESEDDPEYWETYAEARGTIRLPNDKRLQLEVKGNKDVDLSFVTLLSHDTLYSIDLSESIVRDWEL
ncbi:MAG TPA: hypothetical protein VFA15_00485, partial [Nitrososphaera sp.]|nr:hypothetical protein [Nitrososphaera sp.]